MPSRLHISDYDPYSVSIRWHFVGLFGVCVHANSMEFEDSTVVLTVGVVVCMCRTFEGKAANL